MSPHDAAHDLMIDVQVDQSINQYDNYITTLHYDLHTCRVIRRRLVYQEGKNGREMAEGPEGSGAEDGPGVAAAGKGATLDATSEDADT